MNNYGIAANGCVCLQKGIVDTGSRYPILKTLEYSGEMTFSGSWYPVTTTFYRGSGSGVTPIKTGFGSASEAEKWFTDNIGWTVSQYPGDAQNIRPRGWVGRPHEKVMVGKIGEGYYALLARYDEESGRNAAAAAALAAESEDRDFRAQGQFLASLFGGPVKRIQKIEITSYHEVFYAAHGRLWTLRNY